jgi:hypothetical protein
MNKRIISSFLVVSLLNLFGCYSADILTVPQYNQVEESEGKPDEIKVTTKDYKEYQFLAPNFHIENDTLYGKGKLVSADNQESVVKKIAVAEIVSIEVEKFELANTCLLSGGIFFGIAAIIGLIGVVKASEG